MSQLFNLKTIINATEPIEESWVSHCILQHWKECSAEDFVILCEKYQYYPWFIKMVEEEGMLDEYCHIMNKRQHFFSEKLMTLPMLYLLDKFCKCEKRRYDLRMHDKISKTIVYYWHVLESNNLMVNLPDGILRVLLHDNPRIFTRLVKSGVDMRALEPLFIEKMKECNINVLDYPYPSTAYRYFGLPDKIEVLTSEEYDMFKKDVFHFFMMAVSRDFNLFIEDKAEMMNRMVEIYAMQEEIVLPEMVIGKESYEYSDITITSDGDALMLIFGQDYKITSQRFIKAWIMNMMMQEYRIAVMNSEVYSVVLRQHPEWVILEMLAPVDNRRVSDILCHTMTSRCEESVLYI